MTVHSGCVGPTTRARVSGSVRHGDVGDVAHEPSTVVQAPHEIDVLAVTQCLVEAVAETVPAN